jgi:carbon-monoxide dehydrogenase medium subunit
MKPFSLYEPTTIPEAVAILSDRADTAKLYAGGTELLLAMKSDLLHYDHLVNVKTVAGLDTVKIEEGALVIGAAVTHSRIEREAAVRERFPLVADVEQRVANVRVRNVGTLAGNLCFAEPHSDPATLLLIYEASVTIAGPSHTKSLPISELQTGPYETVLNPDELLVDVRVPPLPTGMHGVYMKFGYHHRPSLGLAAAVAVEQGIIVDVRLALGCVSPVAKRLDEAEAVLRGERIDMLGDGSTAVLQAGRIAAAGAGAIDDLHGSAEYKEHLVSVFLERALRKVLDDGGAS